MLNNLIELKNSLETLRVSMLESEKAAATKIKTCQLYLDSEAVEKDTAPDFERKLESAIIFAGSRHTFECILIGTQPFEIKWFKNGISVDNFENISSNFNETTCLASLTIENATLNDNALFSCKVVNDLGLAETSAFLKVKGMYRTQGKTLDQFKFKLINGVLRSGKTPGNRSAGRLVVRVSSTQRRVELYIGVHDIGRAGARNKMVQK